MTRTTTPATVGDLAELIPDFLRSLRAANKSPRTVDTPAPVGPVGDGPDVHHTRPERCAGGHRSCVAGKTDSGCCSGGR